MGKLSALVKNEINVYDLYGIMSLLGVIILAIFSYQFWKSARVGLVGLVGFKHSLLFFWEYSNTIFIYPCNIVKLYLV